MIEWIASTPFGQFQFGQLQWDFAEAFWLLAALPVVWGVRWLWSRQGRQGSLTYTSLNAFDEMPRSWRQRLHLLPTVAYSLATVCLIAALARPQQENVTVEQKTEGIDIVISMDISSSMRAEDLKPNRLEAAREVALDFVDGRLSDRIGMVVFARQSYTACPPTLDYTLLKNVINELKMGQIQDGTAIGMGLATAVNRLKDSDAKSRVIILLTDGMNNAGEIDPVTAAELAQTYQIKLYTIGVGSRGTAPYPVDDPLFGRRYQNVSVDLDEEMLTEIATKTGGQYFRAVDTEELAKIYDQIDEMEKTEVEEIIYTDIQERYPWVLIPGLVLLLFGWIADRFWLRSPLFMP